MGALTPVTSLISTVSSGINAATKIADAIGDIQSLDNNPILNQNRDLRRQQEMTLAQLKQRQDQDLNKAQQDATRERETISAQSQADKQRRERALKRAAARQRAKFGAQGISTNGGSADAIMLGLFEESETERTERDKLDKLRLGAIDQAVTNKQRSNLLQITQLRERQALERSLLN